MVQRSWLTRPSDVEWDNFELHDQYYLNLLLPYGDGGTLTLQSMWVDATLGDSSVPEAMALNLVVSQMQSVYEDVEAYLDANGAAEQPKGCASAPSRGGWAGLALFGLLGVLGIRRRR